MQKCEFSKKCIQKKITQEETPQENDLREEMDEHPSTQGQCSCKWERIPTPGKLASREADAGPYISPDWTHKEVALYQPICLLKILSTFCRKLVKKSLLKGDCSSLLLREGNGISHFVSCMNFWPRKKWIRKRFVTVSSL